MAPNHRDQLQLIQEIKKFTEERIGMKPTDNFTTYYDPGQRPISYTVSGCRKDRFESHLWHFSIVGAVPYKGYFNREDAEREKARLDEQGYDTLLSPVAAYSTLGYFKDPVLSHFLAYPRPELTALIVHELAHSTVYAPGQGEFNESMAEFVAQEAGLQFLKEKFGEASEEVVGFLNAREDDQRFESFVEGLHGMLDALYRSGAPTEETLRRRDEIFQAAKAEFAGLRPKLKRKTRGAFERIALNNAVVLSWRMYMRYDYWKKVFDKAGGDWPTFWAWVREAAASPRPFQVMNERVR